MCISKQTLEMVLKQIYELQMWGGNCTKYIVTSFPVISLIPYVHILAVAWEYGR